MSNWAFRLRFAIALSTAPSTNPQLSIPFAKLYCRSSRVTNVYTLFRFGRDSSERMLERIVLCMSNSRLIKN